MRLVTAAQMARIDRRAQDEYRLPGIALMESAGYRAWEMLRELELQSQSRLVFLAGKGNNGGDALVMARYAVLDGYAPTVILASEEPGREAGINLEVCRALRIPVLPFGAEHGENAGVERALAEADVIVDGIAGTGIKGALRGGLASVVETLNRCAGRIVALDVPSGLGDDYRSGFPVVRAHRTLTMGLPKRCLFLPPARAFVGLVTVVPVGFPKPLLEDDPESALLLDPATFADLLPPLDETAYKSRRGTVWVLAGSVGSLGAATLAAEAAGRCRAGLVSLFVDDQLYAAAAGRLRSVMVKPLSLLDAAALESGDGAVPNAMIVGPGWGTTAERASLLQQVLASGLPGVLDADAINLLARGEGHPALGGRWVLTPHPGEFARLSRMRAADVLDDPYEATQRTSERLDAVVVLKSHVTFIAEPCGRVTVVDGMNAALGTGGSGDVLAGMIGGLIAAGVPPARAAAAGVAMHATAARRVRVRGGLFLAEDLLPAVSELSGGSRE